jgi:hypothetical protein
MPKWRRDATVFPVSINYVEKRGYQSSIPRPVIDMLGKPSTIKFIVKGRKVEIVAGDS